jgi:hypothetical protein
MHLIGSSVIDEFPYERSEQNIFKFDLMNLGLRR